MTKSKSAAKLPQGRVLFCEDASLIETTNPLGALCSDRIMGTETPVLVLPMPTLAAAKKRLRIETMEREKLVEVIARAMWQAWCDTAPKDIAFRAMKWTQLPQWGRDKYRMQARAAISVFHGDAKA